MTLKEISVSYKYWDELKCPLKPVAKNKAWGGGPGGDVLHRCGLQAIEWFFKTKDNPSLRQEARKAFVAQLEAHYLGHGNFCRYYDALFYQGELHTWFTKENVMSRDQMIPIVIACGLYELDEWLRNIEKGLRNRNRFFTNTMVNNNPGTQKLPDYAGPSFMALLHRAKRDYDNPDIGIGDAEEYTGSLINAAECARPKLRIPFITGWRVYLKVVPLPIIGWKWHLPLGKKKLHADPINKTLVLWYNKNTKETSIGRSARKVYCDNVPVWDSWLEYWIRKGDPQCPFHLAFEELVKNLPFEKKDM